MIADLAARRAAVRAVFDAAIAKRRDAELCFEQSKQELLPPNRARLIVAAQSLLADGDALLARAKAANEALFEDTLADIKADIGADLIKAVSQ